MKLKFLAFEFKKEGDFGAAKSDRDCRGQSEGRNRKDHVLRKSGSGPCHGGQKGAPGGRRPPKFAYHQHGLAQTG